MHSSKNSLHSGTSVYSKDGSDDSVIYICRLQAAVMCSKACALLLLCCVLDDSVIIQDMQVPGRSC